MCAVMPVSSLHGQHSCCAYAYTGNAYRMRDGDTPHKHTHTHKHTGINRTNIRKGDARASHTRSNIKKASIEPKNWFKLYALGRHWHTRTHAPNRVFVYAVLESNNTHNVEWNTIMMNLCRSRQLCTGECDSSRQTSTIATIGSRIYYIL